jgi:hypothetical protein
MTSKVLRIALLADGRSDRALLPILVWLLRQCDPTLAIAEPGYRARMSAAPMHTEITAIRNLHRPDVVFVHRDAEAQDPALRRREIPDEATIVKVVPVRMTEAWLLFDEAAIRRAADRPTGRTRLDLPPLSRVETTADPKARLREALLTASETTGRQRKRLQQDLAGRVQRVAELIDDYAPLRRLRAFAQLETDCQGVLSALRRE